MVVSSVVLCIVSQLVCLGGPGLTSASSVSSESLRSSAGTLDNGTRTPSAQDLHLILISVDGLPASYYLNADSLRLKIPTLKEIMRRGVYSRGMQSVYPSVTYPAHASMVTGTYPARHGIYANVHYAATQDDAAALPTISGEFYRVGPFWRLLSEKGLTSGSVFWPVTAGEPIDWLLPEAWWDADKGDDATRLRKEAAISTPGLIDSLRAYIGPPLERYFESDTVKTDAAIYILKKHRPNLLLLHYTHLDYHQHVYGLLAPEVAATLHMLDTQIGRIVQTTREIGLYDTTVFLIVSDHGHASISRQVNLGVLLSREGLIEVDADGKVVSWKAIAVPTGGSCSIVLRDKADVISRNKVLQIARDAGRDPQYGIEQLFFSPQIDSLAGDPNAVVMLEARPGYGFGGAMTGDVVVNSQSKSTHGYLPSKDAMLGAFIAAGPKVAPAGEIGRLHAVDLFATISRLLALRAETRDGAVVEQIFQP